MSGKQWPQFDLIMLGVGLDGHTASLFPDSAELLEETHRVVAVETSHANYQRITITLPVINYARHVIFYVSGAAKKKLCIALSMIQINHCRHHMLRRHRGH